MLNRFLSLIFLRFSCMLRLVLRMVLRRLLRCKICRVLVFYLSFHPLSCRDYDYNLQILDIRNQTVNRRIHIRCLLIQQSTDKPACANKIYPNIPIDFFLYCYRLHKSQHDQWLLNSRSVQH